jgi:hypothetical protein
MAFNKQPPLEPGEEPLPAMDNGMTLDQLQAINGTNATREDLLSAGLTPQQIDEYIGAQSGGAAPDAVAQDTAQQQQEVRRAEQAKPRGQTGSRIDLSFISRLNDPNLSEEQATAEYQKLPPALRYVYDRAADFSYNNQGSETPAQLDPRDASGWLDEFYQNQNRQDAAQKEDKANKPLGPRELQVAMDDVALMRSTIDSLRQHEGRSKALGIRGPLNVFAPSYIGGVVDKETGKQSPAAGTAAAGFSSLIDSSRAKVFLPVIQRMRGFGSMQVREAEAAVNSANRMSLELSDKDFGSALAEVEDFADRFEARSKGIPVEEIKKQRGVAADQSPQAADNRPRQTLMGTTYAVNPDGTLNKVTK